MSSRSHSIDMLLPPSVERGAKIGYFSPSSPATSSAPTRYQRARSYLEQKGFILTSGKLSGCSDFYRSGSIRERAEELNELLRDPDVRLVMSTIGGSNSNALLPYLDYEAIKADPKVIVGYSDVTSILLGIYQKTRLLTFYGPALVASFGELPPFVDHTFTRLNDMISGKEGIGYQYKIPTEWTDEMIPWEEQSRAKSGYANTCRFIGEGQVQGRLIGGNLNTMWSIWGSEYMPEINHGDILLIEDSLKSIATVERLFVFLKLNGVFDRVGAILLGKHELFNDSGTGRTPYDVLLEVTDNHCPPIVVDFDCCHTHPMITMPLGGQVSIDFEQGVISQQSPWLSVV